MYICKLSAYKASLIRSYFLVYIKHIISPKSCFSHLWTERFQQESKGSESDFFRVADLLRLSGAIPIPLTLFLFFYINQWTLQSFDIFKKVFVPSSPLKTVTASILNPIFSCFCLSLKAVIVLFEINLCFDNNSFLSHINWKFY